MTAIKAPLTTFGPKLGGPAVPMGLQSESVDFHGQGAVDEGCIDSDDAEALGILIKEGPIVR